MIFVGRGEKRVRGPAQKKTKVNNFGNWGVAFFLFLSFPVFGASLKLLSFNLGLAPTYVPYAKERVGPLIAALKEQKADVVCLQEVWSLADQLKMLKALKGQYPYSALTSSLQRSVGHSPPCSLFDLLGKGKFVSCLATNCLSYSGDNFTQCILRQCGPSLQRLKQEKRECATSLMTQVGLNPLSALWNVLSPFKKIGTYAFDGQTGIMLFSRFPLSQIQTLDLFPNATLNARAVLKAKILWQQQSMNILCTHLTSDLSEELPYTGILSSWQEENSKQVDQLLTLVSNQTILMGDFNCSLENKDSQIGPSLRESCQKILHRGLQDPHLKEARPQCTFCRNNSFNSHLSQDLLIDHIFLTPLKGLIQSKSTVVLKQTFKRIPLSDHYGLQTILNFE